VPEPRLWEAAPRVDKAELWVCSVCVFCPEQWRLEYGLRLEPANQAALDAGTRHHERKAIAERVAGGSIGLGRVLVAVALVILLLCLLWQVWR
jgi:hypothetical protein